jgi:hypothetical protein
MDMRTRISFPFLASVVTLLLLAATAVAQPTTCTVTSGLDEFEIVEGEFSNPTPGGLRALLADTTCDTITFGGDYIIRLATTLSINRNVTIDGDGRAVTISGDTDGNGTQDVAVFKISRINYEDPPLTVALQNITVTKGHNGNSAGGGIANQEHLTVSNCTVFDNTESCGDSNCGGAGILNDGTLEVINSTFSGNRTTMNGGGILNNGTLTVTGSTFSDNVAQNGGGGIYNSWGGTLTVATSTFSDNAAARGGGVYLGGTNTLTNVTFSGNSAGYRGGGAYFGSGEATLTNCTFSGNTAALSESGSPGGAIDNSGGVVTVRNSIVAQGIPCDSDTYECKNCSGTIGGEYNLVDDNTCGGSFTYSPSINLGALGNYGGSTQTIPLLAGSSAIDTGFDYDVDYDQRGVARPQGAGFDIGAYEADTTPPVLTVPANMAVEATGPAGAVVTFAASATDDVGGVPVDGVPVICTPPSGSTFTIGTTTVTCTATDLSGNTESAIFTVTVQDTTAPVIVPHANMTTDATSASGAIVTYTSPSWTDAVAGSGTAGCVPTSGTTFQVGTTTVTCTATDAAGNTGSASFTVTVTSTITVTATPSTIWPPNKKMVPVKLVVTPADATAYIVSVTCNEAIAASDWKITGPLTVDLRADRNGNGTGRIYTIKVAYGTASTTTVVVKVPHDQGK